MNKLVRQAFTLIELLVVIAIIGILSGMIVVAMGSATQKATIAKAQVFSNSLRNSLMANIIGEWKFDGDASDSWGINEGVWNGSSGGTNLTANYRPETECINKQCLNFDGADDYINVNGGNVTLDLTQGYTVEAWAKFETLTGDRGLIRRYASANLGWFIFAYRNSSSADNYIQNVISYTDTGNVTQAIATHTFLQENKWYHLMITTATNGVSKFYVDSVVVSTNTPINFLKLGGNTATNTSELQIGGPYWLMDGMIDNVRLYNAAIPTSQIKENYYAGLNSLLSSNQITEKEYSERINSIASNE